MSGVRAVTKLATTPGPIGKKHIEIAQQWIGSAAAFGAVAGVTLCYVTDWRVIVDYIPYYNGKFKEQ
ncbi:cytochrome b-c1 complex subunit 10 [Diabrotica virgifera virgifera]|uniref:Cytochrome b-c1 complex subunit 10-like n=1 Tax=Diabrotica virgifera virgifera TaxID=50390 RepID=A0A6P7G590_DIAVI|nr:cytochrome b-c1 complex subunit 10 [Diabrotica virgifera virgifera]